MDQSECLKQIDQLLSLPDQVWFLGAGVSKDAGVPLMYPLTEHVESILKGRDKAIFQIIRWQLPEDAHVEHVLSQIGDLIALIGRSKLGDIKVDAEELNLNELHHVHSKIQEAIRDTLRFGYKPKSKSTLEEVGKIEKPIVSIEPHVKFVNALFKNRRAGFERRSPVSFFTTNYDTLLEDALSLCGIPTLDGFSGGAMAYWDPGEIFDPQTTASGKYQAIIHKLHGSIDWFLNPENFVVRRRDGAGYPKEDSQNLLIYPQATKYRMTQKDPFASLFRAFRAALKSSESGLLAICGYSFRDDHINEEINHALSDPNSKLTLVAFVHQGSEIDSPTEGLPSIFVEWFSESSGEWRDRIIVAGSRGVYHGDLTNIYPAEPEAHHDWWSFNGITNFLKHGPEESNESI